jgi:hypothetical protein
MTDRKKYELITVDELAAPQRFICHHHINLNPSVSLMNIASDTSLIITTYNTPPFLELVLKNRHGPAHHAREVNIADDGRRRDSTAHDATADIPRAPLHSWIPEKASERQSRNVAAPRPQAHTSS